MQTFEFDMHTRNGWQIARQPASSDGRLEIYGAKKKIEERQLQNATAPACKCKQNATSLFFFSLFSFFLSPENWQLQTAYPSKGNSKLHREAEDALAAWRMTLKWQRI